MNFQALTLSGVFAITAEPYRDFRGFLARTYDETSFAAHGLARLWKQESWSHTQQARTLRGLHLQLPPHTETKLITIVNGRMQWVVVDVRRHSPTFGRWESIRLSGTELNALFVSAGFAHGCLSLSDNCDLIIKSDQEFQAAQGVGIAWNDPDLDIPWEHSGQTITLSERDRNYPSFQHFLAHQGGLD